MEILECSWCDWSVTIPTELADDIDAAAVLTEHVDRDHLAELRPLAPAR